MAGEKYHSPAASSTQPDLEASHPKAQTQEPKRKCRLSRLWKEDVNAAYADNVCLMLCLITGLADSSAYNAWSCFLGMQTGNTILLGLGASGQPANRPWAWLRSLTSITSFFIGAFIFARITSRVGARRRGTLFCSFMAQTSLIIIATSLIEAGFVPHTQADMGLTGGRVFLELIPIALLAFQSAGSLCSSRALGYNEIPTLVLTIAYFEIAADPKLCERLMGNPKRNRRIGMAVMLLFGGVIGGWLSRSSAGMQSALWMAAALKFSLGTGWWIWKSNESSLSK